MTVNNSCGVYMRCKFPIQMFCLLLLSLCGGRAWATHVVGGEMTYRFLGTVPGGNQYEVTLSIYEDCINGAPDAIAADNPASITVFDAVTSSIVQQNRVYYALAINVPANFSNSCITNFPNICLTKKTFTINYVLPPSTTGYLVAYQKCCRNLGIINIASPGAGGSTYMCFIPPVAVAEHNSSAIFKNYPPQVICLNNPLTYDNSATDADGDSLSYEFCNSLDEVGSHEYPLPPPYDTVAWLQPVYYYNKPITGYPPIVIDPVTGLMTGTPNRVGRHLVTVCCHEWRNGIMINTTSREFQFVVTDCSRAVVADIPQFSTEPNTYILNCTDHEVHFENKSKGGYAYLWDFGVTDALTDSSSAFEPTFNYPDSGIYVVKLIVNPGGTCQDSISKLVKIYPVFHVGFTDTGNYCPGLQIQFADFITSTIKPVTGWQWNFGDGSTSAEPRPVHAFEYGGAYNVVLVSQNIKGCADTALRKVVVDNFKPYAGDDTTIVKGESILFSAQGGVAYSWWPGDGLNVTDNANPKGYYPDTGLYAYVVQVVSAYGCMGAAEIKVRVVDQASFFVPNAFTPNGDGLNDVFRPVAVGYKNLKYFKVYNRFGEEIYFGETLEQGWDGTYNHRQADIGNYFWMITYTDRFGKEGFMKGDVILIR
jgi:gliding motility-associated-like protein